jgi:hypothetical protein
MYGMERNAERRGRDVMGYTQMDALRTSRMKAETGYRATPSEAYGDDKLRTERPRSHRRPAQEVETIYP